MITLNFYTCSKPPSKKMIDYALYLGIRGGAVAAMSFDELADAISKYENDLINFFEDRGKCALGCKSPNPHKPKKGTNKPGQCRPERWTHD
jgi:hypothetical protein